MFFAQLRRDVEVVKVKFSQQIDEALLIVGRELVLIALANGFICGVPRDKLLCSLLPYIFDGLLLSGLCQHLTEIGKRNTRGYKNNRV